LLLADSDFFQNCNFRHPTARQKGLFCAGCKWAPSSAALGLRSRPVCWHVNHFRLYQVLITLKPFLKLTLTPNITLNDLKKLIRNKLIFSILQTYYRSPMRRMHELEDHLIETWRKLLLERKLAKPDERPTLSKNIGMVQIGPDARY
jgi:hypothetical protein